MTMPLPSRGERAVCRRCGMVMDDCELMVPFMDNRALAAKNEKELRG